MKSVIINRMYAGTYLTQGRGGGEVINLLHSDDGLNYCFVNPYGIFNPAYNDTVQAVIHTRLFAAGCFEVLGVSVIGPHGQLIYPKGYTRKEKISSSMEQLHIYNNKHPIMYGGTPYIKEQEAWPGVTFVATKLLRPKQQIFLVDSVYSKELGEHLKSYRLPDKRFAKQSLLMYVDNKNNPMAFAEMMEVINDQSLWTEDIIKVDLDGKRNHSSFNFLTLINKEDDELAFSNMFSHFLGKHRGLGLAFAKTELGIELDSNYVIKREFHNIDLWIEDKNKVIVIENKIKSGINGVSPRHDFSESGLLQSQLSKYYEIGTNYAEENGKNAYFFLFVPNYNKLDLKKYSGSGKYTVIHYKTLYDFFMHQDVDDAYYADFCNALYKHTKDIPVDYSEILLNYLIKQIKKQKNSLSH